MPEPEEGAPGQNGDLPPALPAGNQPPGSPPAAPPGAAQPPAGVPFDKDLALQDYIDRQTDRRVDEQLRDVLPRISNFGQPKADEGDPLDKVAQELAEEEGLKPEIAKSFVSKFVRIAQHVTKGTQERLAQYELTQKFSQVFARYEDAEAIAPRMTNIFNKMNDIEKTFVLKTLDGADYLYKRAKREENSGALPPFVRAAAGNPPTRTTTPANKTGGLSILLAKANELRRKGDKVGYEKVMQEINRG